VHSYTFVDADSTRLYAATWGGLYFSGDVGGGWTRSAGALGAVHVTTVTDTKMDGHTILYAATTGGDAGAIWNTSAAPAAAPAQLGSARVAAVDPQTTSLVDAGIYRRAQVESVATFHSSATRDGWVLESSERSSKGGSTSSGSSTLRLGDSATRRQYRSILSFSTGAGLPDNAVITGVTLDIRRNGVTGGGDPISRFGGLALDIKRGHFSTKTTLQTGDFQASSSKYAGTFKPSLVGGWYSIDLSGAGAYVNKAASGDGLTQLRLRFKTGDNDNRTANYLRLYSGDGSITSRPRLRVTYYLP